ncbi:hypothetical protein ACIHFC_14805 [Streptomyces sp. NPDC052013]|uniref:hypothetical protein n=1 Tax=Streptomyces sp. NPDC052013 TaxID=3365679 RepID=UPI0037CDF10C
MTRMPVAPAPDTELALASAVLPGLPAVHRETCLVLAAGRVVDPGPVREDEGDEGVSVG